MIHGSFSGYTKEIKNKPNPFSKIKGPVYCVDKYRDSMHYVFLKTVLISSYIIKDILCHRIKDLSKNTTHCLSVSGYHTADIVSFLSGWIKNLMFSDRNCNVIIFDFNGFL